MKQRARAPGLRVASGWVAFIVLLALAPASMAQTNTQLTKSQLEYNNRGVTLINQGKYDQALGYFQSSLAVGEANVTYLNIGRTYTRMGRCADAAAAFQKVESAPAVKTPSPDEVATILRRYRDELDEVCSSRLRLRCPDAEIEVAIDDAPAIECPELPVPIKPGHHSIHVSFRGHEDVYELTAEAGEVAEVSLSVPQAEPDATAVGEASQGSSALKTSAWIASVGGGLLLTTGLVLDQTVVASRLEDVDAAAAADDRAAYDARLEEYEQVRNWNRGVFVTGGLVATTGVVLWIMSSEEAAEPAAGATVTPRDGGASLELRWRW